MEKITLICLWEVYRLILTNVFLSIAMFFNSINFINFHKADKQISVERNDIMSLNYNDDLFNVEENAPKYFLESNMNEFKVRGVLNKNFEKSFEEFYSGLILNMQFLQDELDRLDNNSQAFSSEYMFHRKNHIITEIENLKDRIDGMSIKDKRKLICYEYRNESISTYDGLLGFSIIYSDKENPFLIGTIVMPEYIGKIEPFVTFKSISTYKTRYKTVNEKFYTEPLNYFDRYFLTTVGFK